MTDQADTSAHGTSGQRRLELTHALELIQAFSPFYGRLLAAGVTQLWIEYETKEGIGEHSVPGRQCFWRDRHFPNE